MAIERLDVIIFGATGFTGKHAIIEGLKILEKVKWGIAGRKQENLDEVLKLVGEKAEKDLSKIATIVADANDAESLIKMAQRAKVIVNCCGPYAFYGEAVVKACIEAGTHHVDVSAEPQWIENIQLKYNDLARDKGVYIVSACGFDSIPSDLGVQFFERHFDGEVNSIECFLESWLSEPTDDSVFFHYGTWESILRIFTQTAELAQVREKLFLKPLPITEPKQHIKLMQKARNGKGWCLPIVDPLPDPTVIHRSQRFLYENNKKRPAQVQIYLQLPSFLIAFVTLLYGIFLELFARFTFGRDLLLKYPKFFSFGTCSHQGPTVKTMKNFQFSMTFYGCGWPSSEKLAEPTDQYTTAPTKTLITKVRGSNPAYGATCVSLLLAGLTIINETDKLPGRGGVLPPGACFANTNLIANLCKNGFSFEVISSNEADDTISK